MRSLVSAGLRVDAIHEALRELRARMEGFEHYGDGWGFEDMSGAEAQLETLVAAVNEPAKLVEAVDMGPLGAPFQLEIAARVLCGEVPAEGIETEDLGAYLRKLGHQLRRALPPTESEGA